MRSNFVVPRSTLVCSSTNLQKSYDRSQWHCNLTRTVAVQKDTIRGATAATECKRKVVVNTGTHIRVASGDVIQWILNNAKVSEK